MCGKSFAGGWDLPDRSRGGITIRPAREEDIPYLTDIYNYEIEHSTVIFDIHPKTPEDRMAWLGAHNRDNHPLIAAVADGRAVGYASLSPYRLLEAYHDTVELSLYVDRAYRRRGIARMLMQAILADARERRDIHTVISVITSDNEASIYLHEQFGFVCCGRMREVGRKFGKLLDIVNYQLMV